MLVRKLLFVCTAAGLLLAAAAPVAFAGDHHRDHRAHSASYAWYESDRWDDDEDRDDDSDLDSGDSDGGSVDDGGTALNGTVLTGTERSISAELTGYSYQDNTPPGSADICCPILHSKAGGTGTFADPITTAVASSSFPPGTRFYVPKIKRYVIVEDSGASDGQNHLDIWVGGQGFSRSDSDACMNSFTGTETIIQNAAAGHPVTPGELTGSGGCRI